MQRRKAYQGWRIAIVVLGISLWAVCNAEAQEGCTTSFFIENDFPVRTDRYYTAGFLLSRFCYTGFEESADVGESRDVAKWRNVGKSYYLGLTLYTPNYLGRDEPIKGDGRPYSSSVLLGGNVFGTYDSNDEIKDVIKHDFHLAVLGLQWGGKLQRWWHDVIGSAEPKGWSSQISDGGEPSFIYDVQWRRLLADKPSCCFDLSRNFGASIGYYTSVHGDVSARFGRIESPFWIDYGPANKTTLSVQLREDSDPVIGEAYLFLIGGMDLVIYNALLQGQFRDSGYDIPHSDMSRAVLNGSFGIVLALNWSGLPTIHLSFSFNWKSEEIKGGDSHLWNSLSIGCTH